MTTNPKDIERGCRMVWKHYTGKKALRTITIACEIELVDDSAELATSRDAWAEHIFSVMDAKQREKHAIHLCYVLGEDDAHTYLAKHIHHLEAALKAAGLWDEWKGGCE